MFLSAVTEKIARYFLGAALPLLLRAIKSFSTLVPLYCLEIRLDSLSAVGKQLFEGSETLLFARELSEILRNSSSSRIVRRVELPVNVE